MGKLPEKLDILEPCANDRISGSGSSLHRHAVEVAPGVATQKFTGTGRLPLTGRNSVFNLIVN